MGERHPWLVTRNDPSTPSSATPEVSELVERLREEADSDDKMAKAVLALGNKFGVDVEQILGRPAPSNPTSQSARYMREAATTLETLEARVKVLERLGRELVAKLDAVLPAVDAVVLTQGARGYPYTGPTLGDELTNFRAALNTDTLDIRER